MVNFNFPPEPTELGIFCPVKVIQRETNVILVDQRLVSGEAIVINYDSWYFGCAFVRVPVAECSAHDLAIRFSKLRLQVKGNWLDAIGYLIIPRIDGEDWQLRADFFCLPPAMPWL